MYLILWFKIFIDRKFSVSDDCNAVGADLKIVVDGSQLPAQHGTDVKFTCPRDSDLLNGNVKAVCMDQKISLSPENVSPCKEKSTQLEIWLWQIQGWVWTRVRVSDYYWLRQARVKVKVWHVRVFTWLRYRWSAWRGAKWIWINYTVTPPLA